MLETSEHECAKYRVLVDKYSKLLHPHHYQVLPWYFLILYSIST